MKNAKPLLLIIILTTIACGSVQPEEGTSTNISHESWNELLNKHVDKYGNVNYQGFKIDSSALIEYLSLLSNNLPSNSWTDQQQLAYWINVYNAFTIKLIIDHYPISSIKDIGSRIQIPFVNTPWQIEFIKLGERNYDLDNIEHDIIRQKFNEPRIHFALVCAAKSCPNLRNEAYESNKLETQLADQTVRFLADTSKNKIMEKQLKLSKIFRWYKQDFTKSTQLIEYINQYTYIEINVAAEIDYLDYDWRLNESQ